MSVAVTDWNEGGWFDRPLTGRGVPHIVRTVRVVEKKSTPSSVEWPVFYVPTAAFVENTLADLATHSLTYIKNIAVLPIEPEADKLVSALVNAAYSGEISEPM